MPDPRAELLVRIIDEASRNGLVDRSLRDLANAVGSSHRMLLYHFGSREGLVAEIVAATEAAQREVMRDLATTTDSPSELARALWARVSSPELRPYVRLFFESLAAQARDSSAANDLTDAWLDAARDAQPDLTDPVDVRLGVAVTRGLLIDVLATGDVGPATESLERYLTLVGEARTSAAR